MDDLISRQAAIDALCRRCDLAADDDEPCTEKCNDIKMLEKLPSAQPEQWWIPCSERLPSKGDHIDNMVLVCYGNGSVRFNTYMNGWVQGNPIAWMPLPEPYTERGEQDG